MKLYSAPRSGKEWEFISPVFVSDVTYNLFSEKDPRANIRFDPAIHLKSGREVKLEIGLKDLIGMAATITGGRRQLIDAIVEELQLMWHNDIMRGDEAEKREADLIAEVNKLKKELGK